MDSPLDSTCPECCVATRELDCFMILSTIRLFFKIGATQSPGSSHGPGNVVSECIALGSADATFSVWLTHKSTPLIRGKRFSSGGITDLAWSRDGFTLLCCSLDGKVFGVNFEENELGKSVSEEVRKRFVNDVVSSGILGPNKEQYRWR